MDARPVQKKERFTLRREPFHLIEVGAQLQ